MRKIIDSHMHIRGLNYSARETIENINDIRENAGLDSICVASLSAWDKNSMAQNAYCLLFKALHPENYAYCGLDYYGASADRSTEGRLRQIKEFMDMGFDGIKFIEYKPSVMKLTGKTFLDEEYAGLLAYLEKNEVPVLWHVADPEENWDSQIEHTGLEQAGWYYGSGDFPSKEDLTSNVQMVLERYPRLRAVFAHFLFLSANPDKAADILNKYPSVYLDITPGIEMYHNFEKNKARIRDFFIHYQDRIIFGTDNGWGDDSTTDDKLNGGISNIRFITDYLLSDQPLKTWAGVEVTGLCLPESVCEKILSRNYRQVIQNKKPKAVNSELFMDYMQRLRNDARMCDGIDERVIDRLGEMMDMLS